MQREVLMTVQDFVQINALLLRSANLKLYGAFGRNDLVQEIDIQKFNVSYFAYLMLIGKEEDSHKIVGKPAIENTRQDKIGFVSLQFGG